MLVLSRRLQEQIRIGDEVTITLIKISKNCVRIGIEAPAHISVVRAELPTFSTADVGASPGTAEALLFEPPGKSAIDLNASSHK